MSEIERLLNLPLPILAALAAGYIGYRVAYVGRDGPHDPVDTVFLSLVFAAVAQGVMVVAPFVPLLGAPLAIGCTLLVAMVWRKWGSRWGHRLMRHLGVSISDRFRTAWDPLRVEPALRPTQVTVHLRDGDVLMCNRLSAYADRPTGACRFGADGSVALYVTDRFPKGAATWEPCTPEGEDDWGCLISYVPASEITRLDIRY